MISGTIRLAFIAAIVTPAMACGGGGGSADPTGPRVPPGGAFPYPEGRIMLAGPPVDPADLTGMEGLGAFGVFPKDHGGFFLSLDGVTHVPIRAVASGEIIEIRLGTRFDGGNEYAIMQRVSTTMDVLLGHVDELAPRIAAEAGPLAQGANRLTIEVAAGEEIGRNTVQTALDFWILDYELELSFIRPERYPDPHRYSGAYFGYLDNAIVNRLLPLVERQEPPRDGKHDFDIPGRIIGNWFLEAEVPPGQFGDFSAHFAIAYDHVFADQITIADGFDRRFGGGTSEEVKWVKGPGSPPEVVGVAAGPVKYEMILRRHAQTDPALGTYLIEMLDEQSIRVEWFPGQTAGEVTGFTTAARVYVR